MRKRSWIVAAVLVLVMVVTVDCSTTTAGSTIPHFSERKYVKITEGQFVKLLDEAVALSEKKSNGKKVIAKMDEVKRLKTDLTDATAISNIYYSQDVTVDTWQNELNYCTILGRTTNIMIKNSEKKLFRSAAKDTLIKHYGEDYVNSVLLEIMPTEEQLALLDEETVLANAYGGLLSAGKLDEVQELYVKLIKLRKKIATAHDYKNFSFYSYDVNFSRDYSPDETTELAKEIKEYIVPVFKASLGAKDNLMYNTELDEATLLSTTQNVVKGIGNQQLIDNFDYLTKYGLYDAAISKKKENTSYCVSLETYKDGFIFLNIDADYSGLMTMIHEFGHFNQTLMSDEKKASLPIFNYDLAEIHSQGMEVLSLPVLKKHLAPDLYKSYVLNYLKKSLYVIARQIMYDEFEQKVYNLTDEQLDSPDITKEIVKIFDDLSAEYGTQPSARSYFHVPHFFAYPLYCASYSVSLVVAMQFEYKDFGVKSAVDVYAD